MTTIAYRDGVLAADTLFTKDGIRHGFGQKIFDAGSIGWFALMGFAPHAFRLRQWIEDGRQGEQPEGCVILVSPGGEIEIFEERGAQPEAGAPFHAYGSGEQIALGAMQAGATAEEAVLAAIAIDTQTGGEITVLRRETLA